MGGATTMPTGLGNLPMEFTTFVGRQAEVDEVKAGLARSRLLTLTKREGGGYGARTPGRVLS
jgi:hypothetical protein